MNTITIENVLLYHKKIVQATGGASEIRDVGLVKSAINRGFVTFDGIDLYRTCIDKISATAHGLIKNHGFVDGNKRIGVAVMILLLRINEMQVSYSQQELVDLGLNTAAGKLKIEDMTRWINDHRVY